MERTNDSLYPRAAFVKIAKHIEERVTQEMHWTPNTEEK
jgi:hypothetical protein